MKKQVLVVLGFSLVAVTLSVCIANLVSYQNEFVGLDEINDSGISVLGEEILVNICINPEIHGFLSS